MFSQRARLVGLLVLLVAPLGAAESDSDVKVDRYGDALPRDAVGRIGTTRFRHGGTVTAILFAADGRTAFTAGEDRTISRWEIETGRELTRYTGGHQPEIISLALSADGKSLYSCGADATCCRWDVQPPKDSAPLPELVRPKETRDLSGDELLTLATDASWIVSVSAKGRISLRSTAGKDESRVLEDDRVVRRFAFAPDGKLLAGSSDGGIAVWDVKDGKAWEPFGNSGLSCMAFAPKAPILASGDFDNHVVLWDLTKRRELASLEGHRSAAAGKKNGVFCLAFSPDGQRLATGAGDATVHLWDVDRRKLIAVLEGHTERVTALAFSPDGKRLLSGGADNLLRLWDVETAKEVPTATEPSGPLTALSVHPDGQVLAALQSGNKVRLWDLSTGKPSDSLPAAPPAASAVLFLPDSKTMLTGDPDKDLFHSWNLKTGKDTAWTTKAPNGIGPALGVDAVGKRLVSANPSGRVLTVWDAREGTISRPLENIGGSNVVALAVSPDGLTAAGAGSSASIRLWRLADGKPLLDCSGHPGGTTAVAFSPDGRQLASVGKDRMIRLWEVLTGQELRAMGGQKGWVVAVAFDPKGRLLATGNIDGAVRLWDARNGKLLLELTGHRGAVTAVAFTAKGDRLVSISADTTALVWDIHGVRTEEKKLPPLRLKDAELERAWSDLAEGDSATAAAAVQTLARAPDQVVPMLRERVPPPDDARLAQWIKELDDDDFPTRKNAKRKLAQAGKFAEPALRNALKNNPSAEVAARIKELLEPLTETGLGPEQKRLIRSLEVLEMIDGKDARAVLNLVADGPKDLDVTQQAKAALERMIKRDAEKE